MQTHYTHEAPKQAAALPKALANINSKVLDDGTLKKLVDPDIYYAFERCRTTGRPMEKKDGNALATSVREWAQSKGCIGTRTGSLLCGDRFMGRSWRRSWRSTSRPIS